MRPIYLLTAIHTATHVCYTGSKLVISLLALELGASEAMLGVLIACHAVGPLALGVASGRLADRIGMRLPMLIGASCIAVAMFVSFAWRALPALFITTALVGVGFVFFIVSVQNLAGLVPGARSANYGVLTIGYSISNLVGPLIAGYAIDYGGHASAFLIFACLTAAPITVLLTRPHLTAFRSNAPAGQPGTAFDLLRAAPLRRQIIISGLLMAAWELYVFYMPIYGHAIGLPASQIGEILAAFAIATFLVRFALATITARARVERLMTASMLLAAAVSSVYPLLTDSSALLLASFVLGLGLGCGQPLSMTLCFERAPPGRSGEVTGLRTMATNTARLIVPLVSGAFGSVLGAGAVFWMNAVNLFAISYMARRAP